MNTLKKVDLIVNNGMVVTMDTEGSIIHNGAVVIHDGKIIEIGPSQRLLEKYAAGEMLDAAGHIVLPGLINTHTHGPMALFRGLVEDLALEDWLEALWKVEGATVRAETVRLGAALSYAEMMMGGITSAVDMYWYPDVLAEVAAAVGFRLVTGPVFVDWPGPDNRPFADRLSFAREFLQEYRCHDLIVSTVQPHATYTVCPENLVKTRRLADEFGALFHTHCSETAREVSDIVGQYGQTPPHHLDAYDLLGPKTLLAHCVHINQGEIDLLAERGVGIAHCPASNLKIGAGVAPVPKLLDAGAKVSVATDGPSSSNDLNLWTAMRLAALLHKGVNHDPTLMPLHKVVRMVTSDAAQAVGQQAHIGSLEVGERADVILVSTASPHMQPLYDIDSQLVLSAGRDDVQTVIINGRVVMRNRKLQTIDLQQTIAQVKQLMPQIEKLAEKPAASA